MAQSEQHSLQGGKMAGQQDMRTANETYGGFLSLLKWGTLATALITALVVLIIS